MKTCLTVLTDAEADEAHDAALDAYLDDCVLPELPDIAQRYFDRDAWKRRAYTFGFGWGFFALAGWVAWLLEVSGG